MLRRLTPLIVLALLLLPALARAGNDIPTIIPTKPEGAFARLDIGISTIFNFVIVLAAIIFIMTFLIGGITYLNSAGNEEGTTKAKKMFGDAIIGLILTLASWALGTTILRNLGVDPRRVISGAGGAGGQANSVASQNPTNAAAGAGDYVACAELARSSLIPIVYAASNEAVALGWAPESTGCPTGTREVATVKDGVQVDLNFTNNRTLQASGRVEYTVTLNGQEISDIASGGTAQWYMEPGAELVVSARDPNTNKDYELYRGIAPSSNGSAVTVFVNPRFELPEPTDGNPVPAA